MGNVRLKCGTKYNLVPPGTTGNFTGNWLPKDSPHASFQAYIDGTGAVGTTVTIQVSNDGIHPVATALGTITLSGTTTASDGLISTNASWLYVRAVVSGTTGTVSEIGVLMGT